MSNYKRCQVVFNLDNTAHKDLYEWCGKQSNNFSEFTRTVLFLYRSQTSRLDSKHSVSVKSEPTDADSMSELL